MKATDEDSEVFEITDFTTASEWERFIARLEELFHEWKLASYSSPAPLTKGQLAQGSWEERTESLQFADFKFSVTHHRLKEKDVPSEQFGGDEPSARQMPEEVGRQGPQDPVEEEEGGMIDSWMDMMSVENDFPSRAHCLVRWYGLRQFVIMAPANSSDVINTESRANLLLSSISICLNNIGCHVPVFIQVHAKWRRFYLGQCESAGFRTNFEMVHLKNTPSQYSHLAGLLDVFKAKLNSPLSPQPPVAVSIRFTYILQDWNAYSWSQAPPDIDSVMGAEVGCTEFGKLPFGACEDPVSELHLSTTWPCLSEDMIVDNGVYSDLDPLQAPYWNVRVRMTEDIQCLLGDYLSEFIELCRRHESTDQLLSGVILDDRRDSVHGEADISHVLQRLTEPVGYNLSSFGTVVTRATSKLQIRPEEAPIPSDSLNEILLFLFPDARNDTESDGETASGGSTPATSPISATSPSIHAPGSFRATSDRDSQYKEMFRQLKSAPVDSLTMRLAVCLCIVNHSYGGVRAVAHLWQEFVLEMRYRWENNYVIPDLEPGSPNMGCSLLHQKLQMLNCCINFKLSREALQAEGGENLRGSPTSTSAGSEALSSSDDEFFDVDEYLGDKSQEDSARSSIRRKDSRKSAKDEANASRRAQEKADQEKEAPSAASDKEGPQSSTKDGEQDPLFKDSWTHQAEGRLRQCEKLKLLTGESNLYIPVTQQPAPMTEDLLEEHAEVLAKLGTSPEGAHLRARMQSACLLSDMEAFKAANPGCTLGDFVRWYSPRDWVEEEVTDEQGNKTLKGALSQRMQIPGNMWVEVWHSARPVPVRRQKRLFDDTKEAEKVLHFLAALNPADLAIRLMPMLIHAAIVKILEQEERSIKVIQNLTDAIMVKAAKVMRAPRIEIRKFEDLIQQLTLAEVLVTRAQSLKLKFSEEERHLHATGTPATRSRLSEHNRLSSAASSMGRGQDTVDGPKNRQGSGGEESSGKDSGGSSSSGGEKGEAPWTLSPDVEQYVAELLEQPEVKVVGAAHGPVGTVIHGLFASAQKASNSFLPDEEDQDHGGSSASGGDFPIPAAREYILRATLPRPAPWSRHSPQRLFGVVIKDDFRLAGAFTSDTTFQ